MDFRILDLQPLDKSPDIRLVEGFRSEAQYATLTHCWGISQPLKLTLGTREVFKERIYYFQLPRTFQDAVVTTRALGLRYLWIDSLCIIQDSKQDWEKQCIAMVQIYRDSYITLGGPGTPSCTSGFLHPRVTLTESIQVSDGTHSQTIILAHRGTDPLMETQEVQRDSTLDTRAWILQERILSRRVLYIGTYGMHLECFTHVRNEACHYPIIPPQRSWRVLKKKFDAIKTTRGLSDYWQDILHTYSRLDLTHPSDKLPALSGLAANFQELMGFTYLAGLWKEELPRGLAWYKPANLVRRHTLRVPGHPYVAPSWSWASVAPGISVRTIAVPNSSFVSGLEILNTGVTQAGLDPFGEVSDAWIEARGRRRNALIKRKGSDLVLVSDDGRVLAGYNPDDSKDANAYRLDVSLLYLGRFIEEGEGRSGIDDYEVALGVEPVSSCKNTYRRVGLAESPINKGSTDLEDIFRGQSLERVVLT